MCKAWDDHYNSGVEEGKIEGEIEGRLEGKIEGIKEGRLDILVNLVKDGLLNLAEAAKRANVNEEEFAKFVE